MKERVTQQARASSELLTQDEAAAVLRVRPDTLATWRCTKARRIPYVKIGRLVYYRRCDLDAWMETRVVDGEVMP